MDSDHCSDTHKPRRRDAHAHHDDHGHGHGHAHSHGATASSKMIMVLGLTFALMVAELAAGIMTRSLALMADAGHMLSDVAAQVLALLAMWFAARPASAGKSFGYYRMEILASLVNGVLLVCISGFILVEGISRVLHPGTVEAGPMLAVAGIALVVNLVSMRVLHGVAQDSLNVKAAYLELMGDMLASAGVLVAALVIYFTKWYLADAVVSIVIGIAILPRTWLLLAEATNILMEGTPGHIDLDKLHAALLAIPGVSNVHDVHVWTITSGFDAIAAHVQIFAPDQAEAILAEVTRVARDEFGIQHTTIQIEPSRN